MGDWQLTLCVEEVVDQDWVTSLCVYGLLAEHLFGLLLRTNAHVLLAESCHLIANAVLVLRRLSVHVHRHCTLMATHELLRQRHLLELHLVDSGRGRAKQRGGCNERTLHLEISTVME